MFAEYERLACDAFGNNNNNKILAKDEVKRQLPQGKKNPYSLVKLTIQCQINEIDAILEALT